MFGLSRTVTLSLVGWLWADILLGLFVIFLAAASPPVHLTQRAGPSIDPTPIELKVRVDGLKLLGTDDTAAKAEQDRVTDDIKAQLKGAAGDRPVALIFAYGSHADPVQGEKLARLSIASLRTAQFNGAVMKSLHDITPGDAGTAVALEIYLYR